MALITGKKLFKGLATINTSAHQEAVMKWQLAKKTESSIGV